MAIARERRPVLARRRRSQCGQTVNRALILDCSKYLRNVLEIDPERRRAMVEPGIVLGHLNAALKPHGLFFPVDPSTHARCTIGGMAANNSCGGKSIRYGLMADNVAAIDAIWLTARFRSAPIGPDKAQRSPGHRRADGALQTLGRTGSEIARSSAAPSRGTTSMRFAGRTGPDDPARLWSAEERLPSRRWSSSSSISSSPVRCWAFRHFCSAPRWKRHHSWFDPEAVFVDRTMIDSAAAFRSSATRLTAW
jgi:hypothetical protein